MDFHERSVGGMSVLSALWRRQPLDQSDKRALVVLAVVGVGWFSFGAIRLNDDVLSGPSVRVGILEPDKQHSNGKSVGEVAQDAEFGAPARGVPQRSFLRAGVDEFERLHGLQS